MVQSAPPSRMSRTQMARLFISQRLSAAAEDIFRLFEEMITEYEEQLHHQRKKPDGSPDKHPTDFLRLPIYKEEVPSEQQERNPILVLGEEPALPQIKEEQQEQFERQEGADSIKLTLTLEKPESRPETPLLTELQSIREEEEKAVALPSISPEQMKTEPDGEDYGVSGPTSVLNLTTDLEPVADVQLKNSDDTDTSTDDRTSPFEEIAQPHLGLHTLNPGQTKEHPTWPTRNNSQRPSELSRGVESSDQVQLSLCCKVCRKSFLNRRSLIYHIRAHSRDCGLCGKHLEARESLEVHILAHKKCGICGKKFTSVTDLERHMRTHTGERPFSCPVCGKCFGQKGTLTKHMASHTGVKPFGCMLCGNMFSKKQNLQKHMRIHTGEKPYSCSSCGKRFNQMVHLKKHKCRTSN